MSLVSLLVLVIVFGLLFYIINLLPLAAPWKTVALVILVITAILVLLGMIGVVPLGSLRIS